MLKKQLSCGLSALLLYAVFVAPARADFIPISNPNAAYLAATHLMPAGGNEGDAPVTFVTDGINTATFFVSPVPDPVALTIFEVFPGGSWMTWSDPPNSETSTPLVLGTTPQLEIQLASPALVFGFEAEPNGFGTASIMADFFGGGFFLGSINLPVAGDGGARLFAAYSSLGIDDIQIVGTDQFGVAQLRYGNDISAAVPEPASVMLLGIGVGLLMLLLGRRTRVDRGLKRTLTAA